MSTPPRRFLPLNFLHVAILDFMTSFGCSYCHKAEDLLCVTIGKLYDVMKSKMETCNNNNNNIYNAQIP